VTNTDDREDGVHNFVYFMLTGQREVSTRVLITLLIVIKMKFRVESKSFFSSKAYISIKGNYKLIRVLNWSNYNIQFMLLYSVFTNKNS
jgi:hypothetical protein